MASILEVTMLRLSIVPLQTWSYTNISSILALEKAWSCAREYAWYCTWNAPRPTDDDVLISNFINNKHHNEQRFANVHVLQYEIF